MLGKFHFRSRSFRWRALRSRANSHNSGDTPYCAGRFVTDNGNLILDVHGLQILDPVDLESRLNHITGIVTNGLFARRPANVCLMGTEKGVITLAGD